MRLVLRCVVLVVLTLPTAVRSQDAPTDCRRFGLRNVRPGMTTAEVWKTFGSKGDSSETVGTAAGPVTALRYTEFDPDVYVEFDRDDLGRNRGTATALRAELSGVWAEDPSRLTRRFGEPNGGEERLVIGLPDGPVTWIDADCELVARVWFEPGAWWEPGNASYWLEVRTLASALAEGTISDEQLAAVRPEPVEPAPDSEPRVVTTVPASARRVPVVGVDDVTTPVRLPESYVPPEYPRMAWSAGLDGRVEAQARIDIAGDVVEVLIVEASPAGRGFEDAAVEAIRQWRYRPAMRDGRPVEVLMPVHLEFRRNP